MAESGAKKLSGLDSLKLELVVTAMALVLAMSASMGLTVAWIHGRAAGETRLKAAAAFARGAALSLSDHADWGGYPWPDMESAAQAAGLELTLAAGANGRLVFRRSGGATEGEAALRAALFGDWPVVSADSGHLAVAAPVFRNGLVVGAVCFTGRQADGWAVVDVAGLWMIGALGLNISLMGLYLVFFLNRRLLGPLKELARDLASLGRDEFRPRRRPWLPREVDEIFRIFDGAAVELMDSRRRLEDQLQTIQAARADLAASEKAATVGRLASGLAHELGNPIGALTGFIHLLRRPDLPEADKKRILDQSAQELSRMDGSLKELLGFSRPSRLEPEPVDAVEAAAAAVSLARPQKWGAGVEFAVRSDSERPLVLAERNSLLQVLLNLLANAGQALAGSPAPPRVVIHISRAGPDGFRRLTVTDNGPGVAPEDVSQLFEPYFTRKAPGQGTGLGLAVSLSLVQAFGGGLKYAPADGGGAAFTITLKAGDPAPAAA